MSGSQSRNISTPMAALAITNSKQGMAGYILDFIDGLPKSEGKSVILVVVDRLSKFCHFIPLSHPYTTSPSSSSEGMPWSIVSDRDTVFLSKFGQELFRLQGVHFNIAQPIIICRRMDRLRSSIKQYNCTLRCFCSNTPKALIQWLSWVQFCYNIAWHSSLTLTPYQALHGREPPTLLSYVPGTAQHSEVNQLLINRDELLKEIHHHLTKAQERMKLNADKHRREATFHVGHLVYVKTLPPTFNCKIF